MDIIVKNKRVSGICKSCSFFGELDNTHRMASYIIKHPPANENEEKPEYKKVKATNEPSVEKKEEGGKNVFIKLSQKTKKLGKEELQPILNDISNVLREFYISHSATEKDPDLLAANLTV
jgi:hypothetical protein